MHSTMRFVTVLLAFIPCLSHATLVDFTSNNFSTLTHSATWTDGEGVDFTFSSSHMPFTSEDSVIDRINDREKDGDGKTIYTDTDSRLTFSFSSYISNLRIYIEDVDQDSDSFMGFSILPTSVTGDLILSGNTVTGFYDGGNQLADGSNGNLIWDNIYTNSISFDWVRVTNMGIDINEVEYDVATTSVPEPSLIWLLVPGLLFLGYQKQYTKPSKY